MKSLLYFLVAIVSLAAWGCESCNKKPTEGVIAGNEQVLVTKTYKNLFHKEASLFTSLYPDAHLTVEGTSTEEAFVHFLNDSVQIICTDRPLTTDDSVIIQKYAIPLGTTVLAYDALVVVTHAYNPIQRITQSSLQKILTGKAVNWQQIPEAQWSGTITVVLPNKHSGIYTLLQKNFFQTKSELAASIVCATEEEVLQTVSQKPQSIALASFFATRKLPNDVKILAVETTHNTGEQKFLKPTQENIYEQLYPFRYSLYLYTRETKSKLGLGFGTFLLTYSGQKVFQDSGIVPVKIPSRPIQITVE